VGRCSGFKLRSALACSRPRLKVLLSFEECGIWNIWLFFVEHGMWNEACSMRIGTWHVSCGWIVSSILLKLVTRLQVRTKRRLQIAGGPKASEYGVHIRQEEIAVRPTNNGGGRGPASPFGDLSVPARTSQATLRNRILIRVHVWCVVCLEAPDNSD